MHHQQKSNKMLISSILIELRPLLGSAVVCLNYDEMRYGTELVFKLHKDGLRFLSPPTDVYAQFKRFFKVSVRTVTSLIVDKSNCTFRVRVRELKDAFNTVIKALYTPSIMRIATGIAFELYCTHCNITICHYKNCERVLEFPSNDATHYGQYFCHSNGHDGIDKLVPNLQDVFFGYNFIVLNSENLVQSTTVKDGHIYCGRCLKFFGEMILNEGAMKLWADCLHLKLLNDPNDIEIIDQDVAEFCGAAVDAPPRKIIKDVFIRQPNYTATAHLMQYLTMQLVVIDGIRFTRCLLEASYADRKKRYLLMNIMDSNLTVLRNREQFIVKLMGKKPGNKRVPSFQLAAETCFKILYLLVDVPVEMSNDHQLKREQDMKEFFLKKWLNNMTIVHQRISPVLFKTLSLELEANSLILTDSYRKDLDGFVQSYIFNDRY